MRKVTDETWQLMRQLIDAVCRQDRHQNQRLVRLRKLINDMSLYNYDEDILNDIILETLCEIFPDQDVNKSDNDPTRECGNYIIAERYHKQLIDENEMILIDDKVLQAVNECVKDYVLEYVCVWGGVYECD